MGSYLNFKLFIVLFILSLSVIGCEHSIENATSQYSISLVGKWQGNLGEMQLQVEFEEVSFEGAILLTGNTTLTINAQSIDYRVMNGGPRRKRFVFCTI